MTTPTRHAIVGSGNIGSALARLFDRAHIEVSLANTRGPESIRQFAASLGAGVYAVSLEEALESEIIFMAIPFPAVEQVCWRYSTTVEAEAGARTGARS
jgi:predicted dinucleotide-binding enzyme